MEDEKATTIDFIDYKYNFFKVILLLVRALVLRSIIVATLGSSLVLLFGFHQSVFLLPVIV